jgi:hypothetical protein
MRLVGKRLWEKIFLMEWDSDSDLTDITGTLSFLFSYEVTPSANVKKVVI